ncbi:hypothetical protein [Acetivibrio clariflavus]|uniref:Uncharacterized protein n=1 Tax=Acetivibrio clariflavus (strain DSM 19732 / NBRC 101661 / EBR45) TaxID=720554 RepID=G8LSQ2_ACECE|nr:hypothetical protein [Acetivibrio clariflavus]AEV69404.1 hypothetical protein Clocl_2855 [Acetivibrio clariflavus DSM 19732]
MISKSDKELLKVMEECLRKYLKAASLISQEAFDLLSQRNGLLWKEISSQVEILEELGKYDAIEEIIEEIEVQKVEEPELTTEQAADNADEKQEIKEQETEPAEKENSPFYLFDKVVGFMKRQKCDELQWVRTYSYKCDYKDFEDFQIKYFEHKDPIQSGKNYLMFGNTRKHYSIRKSGDDVVGDTAECFEIIWNLSELFNIH